MAWELINVEVPSNGGASSSISNTIALNNLPCMENRVPVYEYVLSSSGTELPEEEVRRGNGVCSIVYYFNKGYDTRNRQYTLYANLSNNTRIQNIEAFTAELLDADGQLIRRLNGSVISNNEEVCGLYMSNTELIIPLNSYEDFSEVAAVNVYIDMFQPR